MVRLYTDIPIYRKIETFFYDFYIENYRKQTHVRFIK